MRALSIACLLVAGLVVAIPLCLAQPQRKVVTERPKDIVNLADVDPSIIVDMMYASSTNFIGAPVEGYRANICYLTSSAAEGLKNAQRRLQQTGRESGRNLTLVVRDCYRPHKAVSQFIRWANDPTDTRMKSIFYPDLTKQQLIEQNYISPISGHSRASSVDLTVAEIDPKGERQLLPMGTPLDFFGERSHTSFADITPEQKKNRALLGAVMEAEFKNYFREWWHFALKIEPYPSTSFDFDIVTAGRAQQQPAPITALIDQVPVLAVLDRDNASPLSLLTLFRQIHRTQRLPLPAAALPGPTRASDLSKFRETYAQFASVMSADLDQTVRELGVDWEKEILKTYDPKSARTEAGKTLRLNGNVMRVFNEKWLGSSDGLFILAGVINRIDRRDFDPGHCGELRLIYRLGYDVEMNGKTYASRMPFTVNMVFNYPEDGKNCQDVASLWRIEGMDSDDPEAIAHRLLQGPLDFARLTFKQMEINAQVARFPSDLENVENRKFAGQAIYWMRIFAVNGGKFTPTKLENTPDVQAILNDPGKQKQLQQYLSGHLSEIDSGVFNLPDNLAADVALSYSTAGSARLANRPFDLVVDGQQAAQIVAASALPAKSARFVQSGADLLERLNTSSCMGCHQSSSTAGFHFLGVDRSDFGSNPGAIKVALDGNRLQLPFSPHVYAELARRKNYLESVSLGRQPEIFRPHPSAPAADWDHPYPIYQAAGDNMPCPLNADLADPAKWSCGAAHQLSCQPVVTNPSTSFRLGQCVPEANHIYAGLSCRAYLIDDSIAKNDKNNQLSFNLRAFRDRVSKDELLYDVPEGKLNGHQYNCRPTRIGVPLGRITRPCSSEESGLAAMRGGTRSDEICAIVGGKGFEQMAKGYFDSEIFAAGVGRGLLNVCTPSRFCREDYICQQMPELLTGTKFNVNSDTFGRLNKEQIGFCTPTYFVYQLRLDGHPNPR
jgi:D-alanyl-D-alanine dipeptidase